MFAFEMAIENFELGALNKVVSVVVQSREISWP